MCQIDQGNSGNGDISLPILPAAIQNGSEAPNQVVSSQITSSQRASTQFQDPLHLLLCHNAGLYAVGLLQLPIHDLTSDELLFTNLRQAYESLPRWHSRFSFRMIRRIKFVQFELYKKSEIVDMRKENDLPSPSNDQYRYMPAPPDMVPPTGENTLRHFYHHPEHAEDTPECLERIPKKLLGKLEVCGTKSRATGWGLQFEEGLNMRKIWIVAFLLFGVGGIIFGIFGRFTSIVYNTALRYRL